MRSTTPVNHADRQAFPIGTFDRSWLIAAAVAFRSSTYISSAAESFIAATKNTIVIAASKWPLRKMGTALHRRMVAAYIVGINLMEGDLTPRFAGISLCTIPAQTGCMLQWNAMLAGNDTGATLAAYAKASADQNGGKPGGKPLCINPVTFSAARPLSLSAQATGAVSGDPGFGAMGPLRKGAVAAECRDGLLMVWPAPGLGLKALPGGSMHYHDVGLFWADISANAGLRAKAWVKQNGTPR